MDIHWFDALQNHSASDQTRFFACFARPKEGVQLHPCTHLIFAPVRILHFFASMIGIGQSLTRYCPPQLGDISDDILSFAASVSLFFMSHTSVTTHNYPPRRDQLAGEKYITIVPTYRMGDHDISVTCLSDRPHDSFILDVSLHYFGCLRHHKRIAYFDSLDKNDQKIITDRERRILKVKDRLKQEVKVVALLNDLAESLHNFQSLPRTFKPLQHVRGYVDSNLDMRSCEGMSARIVLFKGSEPYTDSRCSQPWPDQKLPLQDLLYGTSSERNPLVDARTTASRMNQIQWFHVPANDTKWIEVITIFQ